MLPVIRKPTAAALTGYENRAGHARLLFKQKSAAKIVAFCQAKRQTILRIFHLPRARGVCRRFYHWRNPAPVRQRKENTMSDKKPVAHVNLFPVKAAIWKNANEKGEAFYNVTFERGYRDSKGEWQSSTSFGLAELLLVAKVADLAHSEIYKLRAADKQAQQTEE